MASTSRTLLLLAQSPIIPFFQKKYDWEREVTVYPLNASAYLQYFERQMREDLGTRAEIITTEEEMRAIEEDYIVSFDIPE